MKYFIDCGTHFFQGLQKFDKMYKFDSSWEIYSFEANPITFQLSQSRIPEKFKTLKLIHENKAVSNENGVVTVNCDFSDKIGVGEGSNILENPPNKDLLYGICFSWSQKAITSFDFSEFILQLTDPEYIAIKLDIEGAEFSVLSKIIKDEAYKRIDKIYIEFHERFFGSEIEKYIDLKNYFIKFLNEKGCDAGLWG